MSRPIYETDKDREQELAVATAFDLSALCAYSPATITLSTRRQS